MSKIWKLLLVAVVGMFMLITPDTAMAEENEDKFTALNLFYYSMGLDNEGQPVAPENDTCINCSLLISLTTALSGFSQTVFDFFGDYFVFLAPIGLSIWISWRTMAMFLSSDTWNAYMLDVLKTCTIFFFVWLLVGSNSSINTWKITGPDTVSAAFGLTTDVRNMGAQALMSSETETVESFQCAGVKSNIEASLGGSDVATGIGSVAQVGCLQERVVALGISTSMAMLMSAWNSADFTALSLMSGIMKTITGFALIWFFAKLYVWVIFLIFDLVVKILFYSAVLPLIMIFALFNRTRQYAYNVLRQYAAAFGIAFALGIVSVAGVYFITNTVNVYNEHYINYSFSSNRVLEPLKGDTVVAQFADFIKRVQLPQADLAHIPADLLSDWMIYLLGVSILLMGVAQKTVDIFEKLFRVSGSSIMAKTAGRIVDSGFMAAGNATAAGGLGAFVATKWAAPGVKNTAGILGGAGVAAAATAYGGGSAEGIAKAARAYAAKEAERMNRRYSPFGRTPLPSGGFSEDLRKKVEKSFKDDK